MLGAKEGVKVSFVIQATAGMLSGLTGSALANPTDLVKVRMQACERNPTPSLVWHVKQIYEKWGIAGFYTGVKPTVIRAMMLNGTQLATYDHVKHSLIDHGWFIEGKLVHFVSAMIAGVAVAIVTSPIDVVKTRVMNVDPSRPAYSGMADCFQKVFAIEGPVGFYKGFNAQWLRIGPLTTL